MDQDPSREAPERSMRLFARHRSEPAAVDESSVVNSVVYRAGRRVDEPATLADAVSSLSDAEDASMAWIGLYRPAEEQLLAVAEQFGLHRLAVTGLQTDIDEIETQVFSGDPQVSRRIYQLSREVIDFQRATHPLLGMLSALGAGFSEQDSGEELRRYLRDVTDHATTVVERADDFRQLLTNVLTVHGTLVSQAQNEEIKKISAWAAILFAPTLIGTVYGMNFVHMPELQWLTGYPFAITLMLLTCGGLFLVFKRRRWL